MATIHPMTVRRASGARALLACALFMLLSTAASAGTLCGTIRDSQTQAPVPRAGVFLRTPAGATTGYHAASGIDGRFCLADVPAGVYDLEVRVDNYRVAWQRGVQVNDTVSGVDLLVPPPPVRLAPPSPNPARGTVRFRFDVREAGPVRLLVLDAQGRLVRGWESELPAGSHEVAWDLRGTSGRVAAGVYRVRLTAAGEARHQRLVVIGGR